MKFIYVHSGNDIVGHPAGLFFEFALREWEEKKLADAAASGRSFRDAPEVRYLYRRILGDLRAAGGYDAGSPDDTGRDDYVDFCPPEDKNGRPAVVDRYPDIFVQTGRCSLL